MMDMSPPDPREARSAAEYVAALNELRRWSGEPSLRRIKECAGKVASLDGRSMIDALPISTVSTVLRQTRLPRMEFVAAFVSACLTYAGFPEGRIAGEVERWRVARHQLTAAPPPDQDKGDPTVLLAWRVQGEAARARHGLLQGFTAAAVPYLTDLGEGDLPSIGRFFAKLPGKRLLILGEPGAGKTVLALELVLQLLEPITQDQRVDPVPVRLTAARWVPGTTFTDWLEEQLLRDHGLARAQAAHLVRRRRILPVLDGLDELDPPQKASELLEALNAYSGASGLQAGPVVVTCRSQRYAELEVGLENATHLELRPLTLPKIGAYLRERYPPDQAEAVYRAAKDTKALATPWLLLLAGTAAQAGELRNTDQEILLRAYIPSVTRLSPAYRPDQVERWLRRLAPHLDRGVDLVPHLLWPIGGRTAVRILHGLISFVLIATAALVFATGLPVLEPWLAATIAVFGVLAVLPSVRAQPAASGGRSAVPMGNRLVGAVAGALPGALAGAFVGRLLGRPVDALLGGMVLGAVAGVTASGWNRRADLRAALDDPVIPLVFACSGAIVASALRQGGNPAPIAAAGFVAGLLLGLAYRIVSGGWSREAVLVHPREALRRSLAVGVTFGLVGGVAGVLVISWSTGDLPKAVVIGLVDGITFGLAFGAIAWLRSLLGLVVAAARGLLPWRLWRFLDWACQARLLRVSGASYQFRHRELQDFLIRS